MNYQGIYFAKVTQLSQYTGYHEQDVHLILKEKVLAPIMKLSSTQDLKTDELWEQYIKECKKLIFNELDIMF